MIASLKPRLSLNEAAALISSKTGDSFTENDVLDLINGGRLDPWWNAGRGRYAIRVSLKFAPSGDQKTLVGVEYEGDEVTLLTHHHRCFAGARWDHCPVTDGNGGGLLLFECGLLVHGEKPDEYFQILEPLNAGAGRAALFLNQFRVQMVMPSRSELLVDRSDIEQLCGVEVVDSSNKQQSEESQPARHQSAVSMLMPTTSTVPQMGAFGSRKHRQEVLFRALCELYPDVMNIPEIDKQKIGDSMISAYPRFFTDSTFRKAWGDLSTSGRIKTRRNKTDANRKASNVANGLWDA
jgi:hypothetical protein